MEPIHRAALDGDEATIDRLVAEDARRTNARVRGEALLGGFDVQGCTPLMLAAWRGHGGVVARLLAHGADAGLESRFGYRAVDYACRANRASALALLLDKGVPVKSPGGGAWTPLMHAAVHNVVDCVALLIARGGDALDMDATSTPANRTALHWAASFADTEEVVRLLVLAGANPTLRDWDGHLPLDRARLVMHQPCIDLLEAATVEFQRPRLLLKARALLDATRAIEKARADARDKHDPAEDEKQEEQQEQQEEVITPRRTRSTVNTKLVTVAPPYLRQRVAQARELPRVRVLQGLGLDDDEEEDEDEEAKLAACVQYALGLRGGGGVVVVKGQKPAVGMAKGVLVELCELMVPKWDRDNV